MKGYIKWWDTDYSPVILQIENMKVTRVIRTSDLDWAHFYNGIQECSWVNTTFTQSVIDLKPVDERIDKLIASTERLTRILDLNIPLKA
jgi:hypothetical protein